ncbi:MAG: hypothetical protein MSA31_05460 [Bacteroidales bacterium]|nr:hypothetical protein [Bacteroidales bacterium]
MTYFTPEELIIPDNIIHNLCKLAHSLNNRKMMCRNHPSHTSCNYMA